MAPAGGLGSGVMSPSVGMAPAAVGRGVLLVGDGRMAPTGGTGGGGMAPAARWVGGREGMAPVAAEGMRRSTVVGLAQGRGPAPFRGVPGLLLPGLGGSAYLYHGGWVLKAWRHRWRGPAAGESSSAPWVPGPKAHCTCSTKGHCEENLKEEGGGRGGPDPESHRQSPNGPLRAREEREPEGAGWVDQTQ